MNSDVTHHQPFNVTTLSPYFVMAPILGTKFKSNVTFYESNDKNLQLHQIRSDFRY